MKKFVLFCEAHGDQRMAVSLIDRVLHEEAPPWVNDLLDVDPAHVRDWSHDHENRPFFDLHALDEYLKHHKVRPLHGHFDGKPKSPGAQMARNIFSLVRALDKTTREDLRHDAVVIVWDMDNQGKMRRIGLDQAREEAAKWAAFRIVYGCPDPEHETWLLAGFNPETDEEHTRLAKLRQELGFCPVREAHRVDATADSSKKNPKRITDELVGTDPERRARCLTQSLDKLRENGADSGLRAFLDEVCEQILPLLTDSRPQR